MRILGIGDENQLGAMYLDLMAAGHEVRVSIAEPECFDVLGALVPRTENWEHELDWIREAGDEGIVVFETATAGAVQDSLRREGFHVVGGSEFGDRLENDRPFGQRVMRQVGMQTAKSWTFRSFDRGIDFIAKYPGRYVYKLNGDYASWRNYIGQAPRGDDMLSFLQLQKRNWRFVEAPDFVLMEYVEGVEVGVGAYFNGSSFLEPACIDWEHKRFFPGDLGELTGEMGTVATYRGYERLFEQTLARMAEPLRESHYHGYVNLNMIVNESGVWPLEFTCRFGYPGFAVLSALQKDGWADLLVSISAVPRTHFHTQEGYVVGIVLTVPPFPYGAGYAALSKGAPITFRGDLTDSDREHLHFGEVMFCSGQLVAAGARGHLMVVTGVGTNVLTARARATAVVEKIYVPNLRYRNDIGDRLLANDGNRLNALGYFPIPF